MAVRADTGHPQRMVRAAVRPATDVMGFQIRSAVTSDEGRSLVTRFADAVSAAQHVGTKLLRARVDVSLPFSARATAGRTSAVDPSTKLLHRHRPKPFFRLDSFCYRCSFGRTERDKLEHDGRPKSPSHIGRLAGLEACTNHLPDVAHMPSLRLFKKMDVLAIVGVVSYGRVAANHLHIPLLPLTRIFKYALVCPAIVVAVLSSGLTRESEYHRVLSRRTNAPPPLSTVT